MPGTTTSSRGIWSNEDGKLLPTVEAQAEKAFTNVKTVLAAAGTDITKVVRTTVFLAKMDDFPIVNAVYEKHFTGNPRPARACVQAGALPLGAFIEITCIALVE
eukprot:gnl/Chilomastix_cuspidata/158.p3 GENE.gnl/Chilomastix_cuspidata/158~~gnl/Chilomastix_cuspidata/158.p3  ORF type:complete len:104 (+),score=20.74 gnl/Chilomastix_cuspidata/158:97-408(+)